MTQPNLSAKDKSISSRRMVYFVWAGILFYTAVFTALKILRYKSLFSFGWTDDAVYNQIAFNTAFGNWFYNSIWNSFFNQHLSLVYIFIGLFYRLYPHIYTLFFLLSFSLALGALGIYFISRRVFGNSRIAVFFSYCYLFFPQLHFINFIEFRPEMFVVPLLIFAFYFYSQKRYFLFLLFCLLIIMCKENFGLLIAMFGILAFVQGRSLKWKLLPILIGAGWFMLSVKFILPRLSSARYQQIMLAEYIGGDNGSFWEFFKTIIFQPKAVLRTSISNRYIIDLFKPRIFLIALFSPGVLFVSLPTFLEIILRPREFCLRFCDGHYISAIIVFIFLATIYSYSKIFKLLNATGLSVSKIKGLKIVFLFILLSGILFTVFGNNMFCCIVVPDNMEIKDPRFLNVKNIFNPIFYLQDDNDREAWRLINMIPAGASVAATGDLLTPLSHRKKVYEFGLWEISDMNYYYHLPAGWGDDAEYVLLRKRSIYNGAGQLEVDNKLAFMRAMKMAEEGRYRIVEDTPDFILLNIKP